MKKLVQTLWACSLLACVPAVFAGEVKTISPDGRLSVVVQYGEGAPLTWQVQRDGRPVVGVSPLGLVIGGKNIAASMNGMPHGGESISNNSFVGHFCIHFTNSRTHGTNRVDPDHQAAVKTALAADVSALNARIQAQ